MLDAYLQKHRTKLVEQEVYLPLKTRTHFDVFVIALRHHLYSRYKLFRQNILRDIHIAYSNFIVEYELNSGITLSF